MRSSKVLVAGLGVACAAMVAQAGTVTLLSKSGPGVIGFVHGGRDGTVVGMHNGQAAVWDAGTNTRTDLAGAPSSVHGTDNGTYVGWVIEDDYRATLWNGGQTNLHPADYSGSLAYGVHDGQQAGMVYDAGYNYSAALWTGTAGSFVNLNPAAATASYAFGVYDGRQVGAAEVGGSTVASLWTGTAASWVNLAPVGSVSSYAMAAHESSVVGYADFGAGTHAGMWTGDTASSWVSLHTPGALASQALAASEDAQVGWVFGADFVQRAMLWLGSAASAIDLHAMLNPSDYTDSTAHAVWQVDDVIYVAGNGFTTTGTVDPLLWTITIIPLPSGAALAGVGLLALGVRGRRRAFAHA